MQVFASVSPLRRSRKQDQVRTPTKYVPLAETLRCLEPQVTYSTYNEQDFDAIWDRYAYQSSLQEWFYKVGISPTCALRGCG